MLVCDSSNRRNGVNEILRTRCARTSGRVPWRCGMLCHDGITHWLLYETETVTEVSLLA